MRRGELVDRAITTEVSSGLTCIGDSVSSYAANSIGESSTTSDSGSMTTSTSSGSVGAATMSSSSIGGMPMVTPGPILAMGIAAAFAYGAM